MGVSKTPHANACLTAEVSTSPSQIMCACVVHATTPQSNGYQGLGENVHFITVTWASWRLKSPATRLFVPVYTKNASKFPVTGLFRRWPVDLSVSMSWRHRAELISIHRRRFILSNLRQVQPMPQERRVGAMTITEISNFIHFNLNMDKELHPSLSVGWNYLSIPKLQRCNRWSLRMDK